MRLLLVHLSDIHLQREDDPVWARIDGIASAATSVDYEVDACLVALTGDITQSGSETEFLHAMEFVDQLARELKRSLFEKTGRDVPVHFATVPGNHDCVLVPKSAARDAILQAVRAGSAALNDPSIVDVCVGVQDSFFEFRRAIDAPTPGQVGSADRRLAWLYQFQLGNELVEVLCLNSAAMSALPEVEGTLVVDPSWVSARPVEVKARIALLHHPFNWLSARVGRELHRQLMQHTDVVLTGHEHEADKRAITDTKNSAVEHIEGGVLQDRSDGTRSSFSVVLVDTAARRQKFGVFDWSGERFELGERSIRGEEGGGLAWTALQNDRFHVADQWRPTDDFLRYLNDPGVQLSHRNRAKVSLSDIFVFPNLQEFNPTTTTEGGEVDGRALPEFLRDAGNLVIAGDDVSGKTSLCKMLFAAFHRLGMVPVLLTGAERPPTKDKLFGYLEGKYVEQYAGAIGRVQQMDRSQRVIIVDDWDRMGLSAAARERFLASVVKFAGHVVVLVNELWSQLAETALAAAPDFRHFRIKPLSPAHRAAIIERWFLLDSPAEDQGDVARQIKSAGATINQLIGRNFVPSYPITVITVLQAVESQTPIDTRASTQGYFYETLINAAIARGGQRDDMDVVRGFLSRLAGNMFKLRRFSVEVGTFREIYAGYESAYGVRRDPYDLLKSLCARQLLRHVGDSVHFRYRYIYYYFVANGMALSIHEPETHLQVRELALSLHVAESANTLLFLAHLVKHPVLADALVEAARELQADVEPARLEGDVAVLDALVADSPAPEFLDDSDQGKQRLALAQDGADDGDGAEAKITPAERGWTVSPTSVAAVLDPLVRLNAGIKAIQILGQILKNSPGTIVIETKQKLMRELVATGLALLGMVHGLYRDNAEQILTEFAMLVRVRTPGLDDEKLWDKTRDIVLFLAAGATFGLVKRMSQSMGARDLIATYQTVLREDASTVRSLVELSLALDSAAGFPEEMVAELEERLANHPFARRLLVQLVLRHFAIFPEDFRLKQRVASRLGVSYQRIVAHHNVNAVIRRA